MKKPYMNVFRSLPGSPAKIPTVSLEVKINEDRCVAPSWVKRWDGKLVRLSIAELAMGGAIRFDDTNVQPLPHEKDPFETQMRCSWEDLRRGNPRAERDGRRKRLVVTDLKSADENSRLTYVLGNAVGVAIAKRVLGVSYAAFTRRDFSPTVFHDYDVIRKKRTVLLEVRGRFKGVGRTKAIEDVGKKFGKTGDFSRALGIVVFPDDSASRNRPDCEIVDPDGPGKRLSPGAIARLLLRYYKPYFEAQQVAINRTIAALLDQSDAQLWEKLSGGVPAFAIDESRPIPIATFGRKSVYVGGVRYFGTDYYHWAAPSWQGQHLQPDQEGVFFWGISSNVIRRFGSREILDLLASAGHFQSTVTREGVQLSLFDDGILMGWAPGQESFPVRLS